MGPAAARGSRRASRRELAPRHAGRQPSRPAQGRLAPSLIDRLDLAALERIEDTGALVTQIRQAVVEFLRGEQTPLSAAEREEVIEQIVYEVTGLGPLEPLFRDPTISDILVNGPKDCYVERAASCSG
jgi:pilus assembly protein CpaF